MRSTEVTVRLPGARIAPTSKRRAVAQTEWRNSGANARMTEAKPEDNESIGTSFGENVFSVAGLPVCPPLVWIKSSSARLYPLGGIAKCLGQVLQEQAWDFYLVLCFG